MQYILFVHYSFPSGRLSYNFLYRVDLVSAPDINMTVIHVVKQVFKKLKTTGNNKNQLNLA